jgi:hypothetical protein
MIIPSGLIHEKSYNSSKCSQKYFSLSVIVGREEMFSLGKETNHKYIFIFLIPELPERLYCLNSVILLRRGWWSWRPVWRSAGGTGPAPHSTSRPGSASHSQPPQLPTQVQGNLYYMTGFYDTSGRYVLHIYEAKRVHLYCKSLSARSEFLHNRKIVHNSKLNRKFCWPR